MARTVHRGAYVRAGEHEQLGFLRVAPPAGRRQVRERLAGPSALVAQQPEPGAGLGHVSIAACVALDTEFAEPEEGEVVVLDPLEEGAGLLEFLAVDRWRRRLQIRDAPAQLLAHAAPVLHRGTNGVERGPHLRLDRVEHFLFGLAIGLDVDDRLDDGTFARVLDGQERFDAPALSRWKRITGWTTRWLVYPRRFRTIRTESTRNGMSSVTISTMVWVDCQPCCSIRGL